jgi:TRAP-type C4-dicarboxylate transport system permease small subunit
MREKIQSFMHHSNTITLWIAGLAIFLMTILGALDVIFMALFKVPIYSTVEMTETLMVFVVYLGLGTVHEKRGHISTDLIYVRLPKKVKDVIDVFIMLMMTLTFALLTWTCWIAFLKSFKVKEYSVGIVRFPIYPTRFFLATGVTIALIWCIVDLIIPRKEKPAGPIVET